MKNRIKKLCCFLIVVLIIVSGSGIASAAIGIESASDRSEVVIASEQVAGSQERSGEQTDKLQEAGEEQATGEENNIVVEIPQMDKEVQSLEDPDITDAFSEEASEQMVDGVDMGEKLSTESDALLTLDEVSMKEGWYCIYPAGSPNKCFDLQNYSENEGAAIQIYQAKKNLAQRFYIYEAEEQGWYKIQNVSSGKVLGASLEEQGGTVLQWTEDGSDGQLVKFYKSLEGYYVIASKNEDHLVYTVDDDSFSDGSLLQLAEYNDKMTQKYVLSECAIPGKETEIVDGVYRMYPVEAYGFAVEVQGGSLSVGANVQLYTNNGTGAQEWQVKRQGSWYTITNMKSGYALDIKGASEKSGMNIQQYASNNSKAQLFRFYDSGNGQYYIMSKLGTVISCAGMTYENGVNIQTDYWKDSREQQWGLEHVVIPSSSEVAFADGYYTIKSSDTGDFLSVEDQSMVAGGNICVESEITPKLFQTFQLEKQSDGWYIIRNVGSDKYLDVAGGIAEEGTNLQQYKGNKTNAQKFKFYDAGNGGYYIKSKLQTVVETVQDNVLMNKASDEISQKWILSSIDVLSELVEITVETGDYVLYSKVGNKMVMDVKGGSKSSGSNIQIYAANNTNAQNFYISQTSDGWYTIQNNCSKMYLDVAGGSMKMGTNLQQYRGNGTDSQKFKFYDTGDDSVVIMSKKGTFIDVAGGGSSSGTNIHLNGYSGANGQRWTLKASTRLPMNEWVYKDGYKFYYGDNSKIVTDVSSIIGEQPSYLIKVNKQQNVVTVYAKDGDNGYIIPVKAMICSTGPATPLGTYKVAYQWRWLQMVDDTWGQWITQFKGDYLFHSECYAGKSADSLIVDEYNKLGTTCSHGCVRLKAGDSKWIYDKCTSSTTVVVYNSSDPGPFGKPTFTKLPLWHTWDPTDPNMYYKCQQKGCH